MARGKASVQRRDHVSIDPPPNVDGRSLLTLVANRTNSAQTACAPEADTGLAEHIVDQLRVAYDELLSAPIPDHLNKLLADLCKAEGKS